MIDYLFVWHAQAMCVLAAMFLCCVYAVLFVTREKKP